MCYPLLFKHLSNQSSLAQPNAGLIDIYDLLPLCQRHLVSRRGYTTYPSAVDANVNTAESFDRLTYGVVDGGFFRDVSLDYLYADCRELSSELIAGLFEIG